MSKGTDSRRRGEALLESLYSATIKLSATAGLLNITFQQIADEAKTSRTVLYRRWSTPFDLLQDIYIYKAQKLFDGDFLADLKDNGDLRKDLLQLLTIYQNVYAEIGPEVINTYYFLRMQDKNNNRKPSIHKPALEKYLSVVKRYLTNAQGRGERANNVSDITLMLPFDLIRVENLIRPNNINRKRLITMVDEILLPVFLK